MKKICMDLGATNIKVALFDETDGKLVVGKVSEVPTDANKGKQGIIAALKRATELHLDSDVSEVAMSSAGNIDSEAKTITYATDNLPGMTGFDYGKFFAENYGLNVTVLNDAHAALLAEVYYGAAANYTDKRVAMLTLGSGVGGGYAVCGHIVADKQNDYARFGHICLVDGGLQCTCGKRGCAEMYLSGRAIHRDVDAVGLGNDLFSRYMLDDKQAAEYVDKFCDRLNLLLSKVNAVCPFDVCVIGGGVADWMGNAFDKISAKLHYNTLRATLGNAAGVYGAYVFGKTGLEEKL